MPKPRDSFISLVNDALSNGDPFSYDESRTSFDSLSPKDQDALFINILTRLHNLEMTSGA